MGWFISLEMIRIVECTPLAAQWDPAIKGKCVSEMVSQMLSAAGSVVLDLYIMLLPLPTLWRLQVHTSKKVFVLFVFACGYL